ncbi:MAG: DUF4388 domain-containing protein [Myxococcota bacterium]|nr:DUF4388 domain-containing protein [Myxococcota bacterium]
MGAPIQAPYLTANHVLTFVDESQFSSEVDQNLSQGRIFVGYEPGTKFGSELTFDIEHPITKRMLSVIGRIVFKNDTNVGFELRNFSDQILKDIQELSIEVEEHESSPIEDEAATDMPEEISDLTVDEPEAEWEENEFAKADVDFEQQPFEPTKPQQKARPRRPPTVKRPLTSAKRKLSAPVETNAKTTDIAPGTGKEDIDHSIPRLDRRNRLIVEDSFQLLGLYVSQLRHGYITYRAEKDAEIDDVMSIRLVCDHTIGLTGDLIKKEGMVQTVKLDDVWSVKALLREKSPEWMKEINAISGHAESAQSAINRDSTVVSQEPPYEQELVEPEQSKQSRLEAGNRAAPRRSKPPAPKSIKTKPEEAKIPVLSGNEVQFSSKDSLIKEFEGNIRNGGLAVQSSPLQNHVKKTLKVRVENNILPQNIVATVVFCGGGTVGFNIENLPDVVSFFERYLKSGAPESPSSPSATTSPSTKSLFSGRISRPFGLIQLLNLSAERLENESELGRCNTLQLLEACARLKMSGRLALSRRDEKKSIYFQDGNIMFVSAEPKDEERQLLGRILLHHKKVTEPNLREALDKAATQSKPVGQVLISLGYINQQTCAAALREQMRLKIESAFEWTTGTHKMAPWKNPNIEAELVATRGLSIVTRRIRQRLELITSNELEAMFSPSISRKLNLGDNIDKKVQGLGLQSKEISFITTQIKNGSSLREAITGSPLGRLGSLRLTGLALAMGLVSFSDGRGPSLGRKPPPRKPTHVRTQDALKKSLEEHLSIMNEQNHFEVLGVHWSASHRSFIKAKEQSKGRFALDKGSMTGADSETKNLVRKIHSVIDDAFTTLSNAESRIQYRKKLFDATERQYAAEMLIKQGEVFVMRGDTVSGIEAFETAYELSPSNKIRSLIEAARDGD